MVTFVLLVLLEIPNWKIAIDIYIYTWGILAALKILSILHSLISIGFKLNQYMRFNEVKY